jgi:hypothetical protein
MERSKRSGFPYTAGPDRSVKEIESRQEEIDFRISQAIQEICRNYGSACRRFTGRSLRTLEILNRRGEDRNEIMVPFYLYPVSGKDGDDWRDSPPMLAVTRDLSVRGIGFRCDLPVKDPRFVAEFDNVRDGMIRMLLEVCWVKKQSPHEYLAGGRLLRVLDYQEH